MHQGQSNTIDGHSGRPARPGTNGSGQARHEQTNGSCRACPIRHGDFVVLMPTLARVVEEGCCACRRAADAARRPPHAPPRPPSCCSCPCTHHAAFAVAAASCSPPRPPARYRGPRASAISSSPAQPTRRRGLPRAFAASCSPMRPARLRGLLLAGTAGVPSPVSTSCELLEGIREVEPWRMLSAHPYPQEQQIRFGRLGSVRV